VMMLLLFFTFGVTLGVISCLGKIFRQRREIAAYRRANSTNEDHESPNNLGDRLK
jgi:putative membrane protein